MGMGEICRTFDGAWKTLGGNGAGLGKRGCKWARLGGLLYRRVFVPAQEMLRSARVAKSCKIIKNLQGLPRFLFGRRSGELTFLTLRVRSRSCKSCQNSVYFLVARVGVGRLASGIVCFTLGFQRFLFRVCIIALCCMFANGFFLLGFSVGFKRFAFVGSAARVLFLAYVF